MRIHLRRLATATAVALALSLAPTIAVGQSSPAPEIPTLADGKPDFSGVWVRPRVADITRDGRGCSFPGPIFWSISLGQCTVA